MGISYRVLRFINKRPALFSAFYSLRPRYHGLVARPDTELIIEGYPRCANSFSVLAFESVQNRGIRIAHHLHAQAQIAIGVQYQIPVLVLIREPISAISSLLTRHSEVDAEEAILQYVDFYGFALQNSANVVFADFRVITTKYAEAIAAVNSRFGTHFSQYENTETKDAEIFMKIDALNQENEGGDPRQLARPSAEKNDGLARAKKVVESHPMVVEAKRIHAEVLRLENCVSLNPAPAK